MWRDLSDRRYAYWRADGGHTSLRGESVDHQCLLTIVGVRADGIKDLVALADGIRESKASWLELLRDLKGRGLGGGPLMLQTACSWFPSFKKAFWGWFFC